MEARRSACLCFNHTGPERRGVSGESWGSVARCLLVAGPRFRSGKLTEAGPKC
jgi:hypothetical protein